MSEVIQHLRRTVLLRDGAGLTDKQLLEDYISRRDEAALEALVQRHGPMVWGVCCRVLNNHHDAEDAFQVTFLVLVRKAASIASRDLLPNWLHGVAYQTALKARATVAKRMAREKQVTVMPEPEAVPQNLWHDLQPLLDQELSRLPEKYRIPVILCDLEGKTRKEAAQQLGCPEGTVAGRLARAREMLAKRLVQHGLLLSGGSLALVLSQNAASACVPTSVVTTTIKTAALFAAGQAASAGLIPAKVAALTDGVMKAMLMTKLKTVMAFVLMMGMVAFTCGILAVGMTSAKVDGVEQPATKADDKPKAAEGDKEQLLTVIIKPQKNAARLNEPFKVDLRVVNSSKSTQSFQVMSCSWPGHWKSSNERVSWQGWPCAKNIELTVKLEPGEAYEKTLPMLVTVGEAQEKVSFKMGFTPIDSKQTYWSNEVTLQVEPEAKADAKPKAAEGLKADTLTVTIKAQENRVRVKEPFKVDLRVVNSSKSAQSFQVMSGSWYDYWKSSNERVSAVAFPDPAKNVMMTVKLEPGEAYEKTLPMLLVAGRPQEKVPFKMGFTPIGNKQPYWSNEITLQVEPDGKADDKPKAAEGEKEKNLAVTIKPQKNRIRANEAFNVDLRVMNSSKSPQSFQVMSCSWDEHWKSSNQRVFWKGWPCFKNIEMTVKLAPGEAYEKALPMLLVAGKPQEKVIFKMGFTSLGSNRTYWSNDVTLTVQPDDASGEEMAKLQGTWTAVSAERDGKMISEEEVKKLDLRLTIKDDEFMWMPLASKGPEHFPHGHFKLDTTKKPKAIDLTIDLLFSPAKKTSTVLGIYEFDGDSLRLLKALPDQGRPTEFRTTAKSGLEVITFKRAKP